MSARGNNARRNVLAAVLATGVAGTALTGCGADAADASAPIVRPVVTASADEGPFAGLTGRQVLERAETAMKAVPGLTLRMDGSQDGMPLHVAIAVTRAGRCAATLRADTQVIQLIGIGPTYYMKADAAYWRSRGSKGAAMARTLAGKWLTLPATYLRDDFTSMCDLGRMVDAISAGDGLGTVTKGHPTTLDGRPVIPLVHTMSDRTTTVYVAAGAEPYVLKWRTPGGDSPVTGTFSDFGRVPRITAPPPNRTVDIGVFGDPEGFSV